MKWTDWDTSNHRLVHMYAYISMISIYELCVLCSYFIFLFQIPLRNMVFQNQWPYLMQVKKWNFIWSCWSTWNSLMGETVLEMTFICKFLSMHSLSLQFFPDSPLVLCEECTLRRYTSCASSTSCMSQTVEKDWIHFSFIFTQSLFQGTWIKNLLPLSWKP